MDASSGKRCGKPLAHYANGSWFRSGGHAATVRNLSARSDAASPRSPIPTALMVHKHRNEKNDRQGNSINQSNAPFPKDMVASISIFAASQHDRTRLVPRLDHDEQLTLYQAAFVILAKESAVSRISSVITANLANCAFPNWWK